MRFQSGSASLFMLLRHDAAPDSRPGLFSKAPLVHAIVSFNERAQPEASCGMMPHPIRAWVCAQSCRVRAVESFRKRAQPEASGGLNPQTFSRPGLFSKPPCTRGCKPLRTSAAGGKRPARERQASSSRSRQRDCSRVQPAAARRRSTMLCFSRLRKQR